MSQRCEFGFQHCLFAASFAAPHFGQHGISHCTRGDDQSSKECAGVPVLPARARVSVAASCFAIFAIFVMCVCDLCTCQCLACAAPEFEYVCILQQSKLRVMLVFCLRNLLLSSEHILSFYICDCRAFDARLLRGQRVVHVFFSIRFLQNRFSELFVCEILHRWQPELATRVGNQSFTVPFFCTYVQWKSR
jgi:hypothetical protein